MQVRPFRHRPSATLNGGLIRPARLMLQLDVPPRAPSICMLAEPEATAATATGPNTESDNEQVMLKF